MKPCNQDDLKKAVGKEAVKYIENGMIVGLGSGSTIKYMLEALSEKIKNENINIVGIPTSKHTELLAESLGIVTKDINDVDYIDLTIDGADQIDQNYQGIKGGGAAHLMEKIVAINSKRNMWIVDETKFVKNLSYPLPVEVVPQGSRQLFKKFDEKNYHPKFRVDDNDNFVKTDSGDYIIDLYLGEFRNPYELSLEIDTLTGTIEHGLFMDIVDTIIVEHPNGPEIINTNRKEV
ncbi:ribose 5-phosphate isomerase A [Lactobacillus sp. S2-2]|uniref:ribose 5-phosphate isomerase A n=1 Tax=Lactobacillus sp. S2-2 TaxID=2692917 RepID=UPI001EFFBEAD|nr:ribose 5-phosphate isomerase A [Lactobacillus sp. S2-2]MCF6515636.1 ribose 5-phosphate isomerase A [Lactobacillus sp. S2-2]